MACQLSGTPTAPRLTILARSRIPAQKGLTGLRTSGCSRLSRRFTDRRHMLAHLERCGECLNFARYSPGDPYRHACNDKDVLDVIDRRPAGSARAGTKPGTGHLGRCRPPGITRYRSRWPQEDKRHRVPGPRRAPDGAQRSRALHCLTARPRRRAVVRVG